MKIFEWSWEDSSLLVNYGSCSICSLIVLIMKFLHMVEWVLKRVSNLIQRINYYGVENKYDLTGQTHSML
jgi:uncharacterized protein HemY